MLFVLKSSYYQQEKKVSSAAFRYFKENRFKQFQLDTPNIRVFCDLKNHHIFEEPLPHSGVFLNEKVSFILFVEIRKFLAVFFLFVQGVPKFPLQMKVLFQPGHTNFRTLNL